MNKKKKRSQQTNTNAETRRVLRAKGFSEEDSAIIVGEFVKLAALQNVDPENIKRIDMREAFDAIRADEDHPLRKFYNMNMEEAAYAHWVQRTNELVNGIHYVSVEVYRGQDHPVRYVEHGPWMFSTGKRGEKCDPRNLDPEDPDNKRTIDVIVRNIKNDAVKLRQRVTDAPSTKKDRALADKIFEALDEWEGAAIANAAE